MTTLQIPSIETTIGDLVTQRPGRSRVFEKLGIDYCCGGKKSLANVCKVKGLDANTVLTILLAAEQGDVTNEPDWSQTSLTALAEHIEQTHHAYLKGELPRLEAMVYKVASVHGNSHPWMREIDDIFSRFAADLHAHMIKEEHVLFPMIRNLERDDASPAAPSGHSLANLVHVMEHEHDGAGEDLAKMRVLTDNYQPPEDACNTFRATLSGLAELEADMHRHVHKENSILFPRAMVMEQSRLSAK